MVAFTKSYTGELIAKRATLRDEPTTRQRKTVLARITTTAVDRDGDVVLPSGMDLSEFRKNPLVLLRHDQGSLPVGQAEDMRTTTSDITARVVFAERPESHPEAVEWIPDTLHSLYKQRVLRGFSVGFTVPEGGARRADFRDVHKFGKGVKQIIHKWKLIEFSIVPIPANQDALAVAVDKGYLDPLSWVAGQMAVLPKIEVGGHRLAASVGSRAPIEIRSRA